MGFDQLCLCKNHFGLYRGYIVKAIELTSLKHRCRVIFIVSKYSSTPIVITQDLYMFCTKTIFVKEK